MRSGYCECETPIMDAEHDAGCRRCGLPVDFTPKSDDELQGRADELHAADNQASPRCAVCGGPDADGNGCEHCPAVAAVDTGALQAMSDEALRTLIAVERENGRAHGETAEAARLLLSLRAGKPS